MIYEVKHRTDLDYSEVVSIAHHVLHLTPRNFSHQHRITFGLNVDPEPSQQSVNEDYFGNGVHYLTLHEPHDRLTIESRSRVEVLPLDGMLNLSGSAPWEEVEATLRQPKGEAMRSQQFAFESPYIATGHDVRAYAVESFPPGRPILEAASDLTARVFRDFEYQGGVSDVSTPVGEVLAMRKGVCQDFAHFQIACLRSLGLAARYVSGYLLTHPAPGQAKLVGADASHAWLSVWSGGWGWIDFDPTNNLIPGIEHITVAWGRDYGDVSPTTGFIVGGGEHEVKVSVDVSPVG